jgi:HAD superfamily hydrolase (TIGR01459 family)
MAQMGLPPALVDAIYSSGEATFEALTGRFHALPLGFSARRCFHIGSADDARLVSETDIRLVGDPAEADFVLCTGVKTVSDRLEDYQGVLRACLRHGLPMVCANPDLKVMQGDRIKLCAGTLAAFYEGEGGKVVSYGKPHRPVYDRGLEILGAPQERVLAVGDSFRTDVAGANGAGIDGLLIASGLNAESLLTPEGAVDIAAFHRLAARWKHRPRWIAPRFEW